MLISRELGVAMQLLMADSRRDARKAANHCRNLRRRLIKKGQRRTHADNQVLEDIDNAFMAAEARWGRSYI